MEAISYLKCFKPQTCAIKFCLLSVCFISFLKSSQNESCNNGLNICQFFTQCQAYAEISWHDYNSYNWCNKSEGIVCCPQLLYKNPLMFGAHKEPEKSFDKDCKKWQQSVYPKCPSEGLISQGTDAQAKEFPHLALIGLHEDSKYDWYCGGSLISPKFVLTAAHCLYDRQDGKLPNRVRLGEIDYNSEADNSHVQEFAIKNYTEYPEYKVDETYWDIALLELNGEAVINEHVVPICLPHTNGSEQRRFHAAGWGLLGPAQLKATHLQKVILERFSDQECVKKTGIDPNERPDGVRPTHQICAGSFTDKRDTCQGDSGGPLFIEHTEFPCMFELHGITSFGSSGCATKGSPGVYTRLLPYIGWIESIVWKN